MIPPVIRFLMEGAHQAPSADNSQPWRFTWDGQNLSARYKHEGPEIDVFGPDSHCERLTMGAVIENLVQLVEVLGLDGQWDLIPGRDRFVQFRPSALGGEFSLDRQHPVFSRHTNRYSYQPRVPEAREIVALERLIEAGCRVLVYADKADIATLSGLIRQASSMRFRNRQLHKWFGNTLRFGPAEVERGDGLDVRTIELPPGGTGLLRLIQDWRRMDFLNRFGMYRLLSLIESQSIRKSPTMIAILGPESESVAAGRLMERAWLTLQQYGLAAQPYYVLTDQLVRAKLGQLPDHLQDEGQNLRRASMQFFGSKDSLHMLLRAGYPQKEVARSRRVPLETVVQDVEVASID